MNVRMGEQVLVLIARNKSQIGTGFDILHTHTHTPVSYTHLDVYKRQAHTREL